MKGLAEIELMIGRNELAAALDMLNEVLMSDAENGDALYLRGKVYWKLGKRALATSDYAASAAINPDGKGAKALEMARDVESFFNKDMMNP